MKIGCIGELNENIAHDVPATALYLARAELDVSFFGIATAKAGKSKLTEEGVNIDLLHDATLEKFFSKEPVEGIKSSLIQFDYIYVTGKILSLMNADGRRELVKVLNGLRSSGTKVIFDSNHKIAKWSENSCAAKAYSEILSITDISLPNYEEEALLFDDKSIAGVISRHHKLGVSEIALKNGVEPNWLSTKPKKPPKEFPLESIEQTAGRTGAGDAFNAAYIATRLSGESYCRSIKKGQIHAAKIVRNADPFLAR